MEKPVSQDMSTFVVRKSLLRNILSRTLNGVSDSCFFWKANTQLYVKEITIFMFIGILGFFVICLLLFLFRRYCRIRKHDVFSNTKEMFSHRFLEVNPAFNSNKWNDMALKMNTDLYAQGYWRSQRFFSTGQDCHNSFREYVLRPSLAPVSTVSTVCHEAVERYKQDISELYECLLAEEFPSNPKFLPGNDRYGRFKILISDSGVIKSLLPELFWLAMTFAFHSTSFLKIWRSYCLIKKLSNACKLHLEKKYKVVGITQRVKFLATIMHFAPGYDLEKWDRIASHMNWYLLTQGVWTGAHEKFVDGKECLDFYQTEFIYIASNSDNSRYPDLKEIVSETNKVCAPF